MPHRLTVFNQTKTRSLLPVQTGLPGCRPQHTQLNTRNSKMGCCGGDREKDITIKNDVKWEYIVSTARGSSREKWPADSDAATEPRRLQVFVMFHSTRICLSLDYADRLHLRLRRRHIHRYQPPRFQQMGWSDSTCGPVEILSVDLCWVYHIFFFAAYLSLVKGTQGHARSQGCKGLSRSTRCPSGVHQDGQRRKRLETISRLCRIDQESERC